MGHKSHLLQNEVLVDAYSYVMNETGASHHVVVHNVTGQSGVGGILDDADSIVKFPDVAYTSGERVAGVLLSEVVNYDLSRTHLNDKKRQSQVGGKVSVMKIGTIVTNNIAAGAVPGPGLKAYGTTDGKFTVVSDALLNSTTRLLAIKPVGTFRSAKDTDGYCRIDILVM